MWYNTPMALIYTKQTTKRKSKKPDAKARELAASWEAMMKKYEPSKPLRVSGCTDLSSSYRLSIPEGRDTKKYKSLNSGHHDTALKPSKAYTGTKMIGIGTLHKSNAVPVFSTEEAGEMARMRRG